MMDVRELEVKLRELRDLSGYGNFYFVMKKLVKERVDPEREKRKQPSPAKKQKMYDRQKGMCACGCGEMLLIPARSNHADHFDSGEMENFNGMKNMRLLLPQHNLEKSSKSPMQVSKESGVSVQKQIEDSKLNDE